ncbi:hypothetical protein H5Y57_004610 [Salmonella enterica]|nr:hypothetical protein [Salmonella enterica]EBU9566509.1 hypothetical protein [Salmonella enterica subsp. enterica serovar London]EBZ4432467.1 hypothetical protein [Salmonella enterica subsp. enterica serovar Derby]ECI2746903.1 hypothetical protein [Salmonella enterica subsp. enterica]EDQ5792017.1 hypothetical protein [Salmonella enterica subsp. enterica serovar Poona]
MKTHYLLLMLVSASVSSQPLTVVPAHWQEGMAVGVTELSGTLYIRDTAWQWQPVPLEMSWRDRVQARPDAFTVIPGSFLSDNGTKPAVAGALVTYLEDIRVRFPGAKKPVMRWQGNLTPVVNYF